MSQPPTATAQPDAGERATAPPPRRSRADAARDNGRERRKLIADRSAELFNRDGYHQTSMAQIAAAAGVAKATLYHYFPSKGQILFFIHDEFMGVLLDGLQSHADRGLTPAQRLLETMTDILRLNETHPGHVRVFFEHFRELTAEEQAAATPKRDFMFATVAGIIRAGIEDGTFRDVDPDLAAFEIFGMCNWAYQWFRPGGLMDAKTVAEKFWDYAARGLLAEGSAARRPAPAVPPTV
ncbi:TetR family transcriptional regulator [Micromonospora sp. NPDC005087]|uniref:TetR family transcriptional regulator n=1 Tax=Micromonospora sp. NPDC005087 TaxID=3364225 RepID=UPI0036BE0C01